MFGLNGDCSGFKELYCLDRTNGFNGGVAFVVSD